jgi:hypothetical protein
MKCVCDSEAKEFRCVGVGVIHEIRVFKGKELVSVYACVDGTDVIIIDGKVIVVRESEEKYRWVDVHL